MSVVIVVRMNVRSCSTIAIVLVLLATASSCAPVTRSVVLKDGRPSLKTGPLALETSQVAVILWAGSAGDDPVVTSIDGLAIPSAPTNNRVELSPGKHTFVYGGAWKVDDVRGGARSGRWAHDKIDVTEDVVLESGHCYFPRQLKQEKIVVTTIVLNGTNRSEGVSWATEPAHLVEISADPRHFGSRNLCVREK